nr:MAG TPA: signalosome complex subunit 7a protein [Caudoviricetes sp.]
MEESWSVLGLGGPLAAWCSRCFSVLFDAGTSLSCVKAFLTGCRRLVLTSYRVCRVNRSEGPLYAFWRHVR